MCVEILYSLPHPSPPLSPIESLTVKKQALISKPEPGSALERLSTFELYSTVGSEHCFPIVSSDPNNSYYASTDVIENPAINGSEEKSRFYSIVMPNYYNMLEPEYGNLNSVYEDESALYDEPIVENIKVELDMLKLSVQCVKYSTTKERPTLTCRLNDIIEKYTAPLSKPKFRNMQSKVTNSELAGSVSRLRVDLAARLFLDIPELGAPSPSLYSLS